MNQTGATPRTVAAGRGADWLLEGFALFREAPLPWIGVTVIWLIAALFVQKSSVGSLLMSLVGPVIIGGLMIGAKAQSEKQAFKLDYLWAGFAGARLGPLLMLGVIAMLAMVAVVVAIIAVIGIGAISAMTSGGDLESLGTSTTVLLALLILMVMLVPLSMALWFAPALVALQGLAPVAAVKASFNGCMANIMPLTVNGLLAIGIAIVATIPVGLGWLVALPVLISSVYFGYRDIYGSETLPSEPVR